MEILKDSLKITGVVVCCVVLFPVIVLCCLLGWALTTDYQIAKIKLDNNQIIKVWSETNLYANPSYYYEITQGKKVIIPATEIGVFEYPLEPDDIQVAFAQDKTLVCIYESSHYHGLLFLYNVQTGEA